MASELACMSNTPNVDAPIVFINLLYETFMFLNQRKDDMATITANTLLESLTKNVAPFPKKYELNSILPIDSRMLDMVNIIHNLSLDIIGCG